MSGHVLKKGECPICDTDEMTSTIARLRSEKEALVAALKECVKAIPEPYERGSCEHGYLRDSVDEPCPFIDCEDRANLAMLDRARLAIERATGEGA